MTERTRLEFPSQTNQALAADMLRKRYEIEEDNEGIVLVGSTHVFSQAYNLVRHLGAVELTRWGPDNNDDEDSQDHHGSFDEIAGLEDGW